MMQNTQDGYKFGNVNGEMYTKHANAYILIILNNVSVYLALFSAIGCNHNVVG